MDKRLEPGIVDIDSCLVLPPKKDPIDITGLVANITIYEDIMSPFLTGMISVLDATALGEALPLIGEELIFLEIKTPGFDGEPNYIRKGIFHLYKMESRENLKLKTAGYNLCFTSIEAVTDVNARISKTYNGKISDSVQSLISSVPGLNASKNAVVEATSNNEIHTSNFWTPTQNIYYLAGRALNEINNPSYVFFENNEGFVFASIDRLFQLPEIQSFVRDSKMRDPEGPQNLEEEYAKVLDMSVPTMYNYFERVQEGYYGSSVYHYDLVSKRLNFKNLVAFDMLKKAKLNQAPAATNNLQFLPEAAMSLNVIHKDLYPGSPMLTIDHNNRRMALLKQVTTLTVNIRVFGRLDYSVGNTVYLTAYKDAAADKQQTADADIDEVITGKYLITALSHEITRQNHYTNLELSKDSLIKDINKAPQ